VEVFPASANLPAMPVLAVNPLSVRPSRLWSLGLFVLALASAGALERADRTFRIFQFPADQIPRIDGRADDWAMVTGEYVMGNDHLVDDSGRGRTVDPASLDIKVRVGWVQGLNRLYFLYEAHDDYWDFSGTGLQNDTFEIVVDGDRSGGPLIDRFHPDPTLGPVERFFAFHGVHAQNYHIFTPALGKDWALAWGPQTWIKRLPYANAKSTYSFAPGEAGRLVLEFWITPFDYAGAEGPVRAVESVLTENKTIGLAWAVIDYDDAADPKRRRFWNLSPKHTMFGNASELVAFTLAPLEPGLKPALEVDWSFTVLDRARRQVAFRDQSLGDITTWKWDFGDGETSSERNPVHVYAKPADYIVVLTVSGPAGTSRRAKVWEVVFK
jgi:hypothetical protein